MLIPAPSEDKFDAVSDFAPLATFHGDVGAVPEYPDHVANLIAIRDVLIARRRIFAQDAVAHPVVTMGRSQDIIAVSRMVAELDSIIADERSLST